MKLIFILFYRFFRFSLFDFNNYTKQTLNKLFDFLEFPKDRHILALVTKPDRNFEAYSNDHLPPEHEMGEKIEQIRSRC